MTEPRIRATYDQRSGAFEIDGEFRERGYSGHGKGLNNPDMEYVKSVGPLPRGLYIIGHMRVSGGNVGPYAVPLLPHPSNNTHGRGDFFAHGDTRAMNKTASHGCIILTRPSRLDLGPLEGQLLEVV